MKIDETVEKLARDLKANHLLRILVLSAALLSYAALIYLSLGWYSGILGGIAAALLTAAGGWFLLKFIRRTPAWTQKASEIIDRKFDTKERAVSYTELNTDDGADPLAPAKKDMIERQLEEILKDKDAAELSAREFSKAEKRIALSIPVVWIVSGVLLWFLYFGVKPEPAAAAQNKIENLLELYPNLPDLLKAALQNLLKQLEDKALTDEEVQDALLEAEEALAQAEQDGETQKGGREGKENQRKSSDAKKPTPTPTPTPTPAAQQPPDQKQQQEQKEQGGEEKGQQDVDVQNSKSTEGEKGEKSDQAQKDQESKDGEKGEGDSKQEGNQGKEKQEGQKGGEGKEEQKGSGQGSQESEEKGEKGGKGGKGGEQDQQQQGDQGDKGDKGDKGEKGEKGSQSGSQSGDGQEQGQQGQQGQQGGQQMSLQAVMAALQELKAQIEKQQQQQKQQQGNQGQGEGKQDQKGQKGGKSGEKEQDKEGNSGGGKDARDPQQEKAEQTKGGKGEKGKPEQNTKDQNPNQSESSGEGSSEMDSNTAQDQSRENDKNKDTEQKQTKSSKKEPPTEVPPQDWKVREGDFGDGEGKRLEGEKSFKDITLGETDDDLDPTQTGEEGQLREHSAESRAKTKLGDVQLAKPDAQQEEGKQEIPLEYKDLL